MGLPFGHVSVIGPLATTTLAICEHSLFLMGQPGSEEVFIWDQRANQSVIGDQHGMEFFVGKGSS